MKWLIFLFPILLFSNKPPEYYILKKIDAEGEQKLITPTGAVFDDEGYLWITTQLGLYRYDGDKLIKIASEKYPEIANERISRIAFNKTDKSIYFVIYPSKKLFQIKNNKIEKVDNSSNSKMFIMDFYEVNVISNPILFNLIKKVLFKDVKDNNMKDKVLYVYSFNKIGNYVYIRLNNYLTIIDTKSLKVINNIYLPDGDFSYNFSNNKFIALKNNSLHFIVKDKLFFDKQFNYNAKFSLPDLKKKVQVVSNDGIFGKYLVKNGKVYEIMINQNSIQYKFLFNSPTNDISNIIKNEKQNLFVVVSVTNGIFIVKKNPFTTIRVNDSQYDISYSTFPLSNGFYNASGYFYDVIQKKMSFQKVSKTYINKSFLFKYENQIFLQNEDGLINILNNNKVIKLRQIDDISPRLIWAFKVNDTYLMSLGTGKQSYLGWFINNQLKIDDELTKHFFKNEVNCIVPYIEKDEILFGCIKGVYVYNLKTKKLYQINSLKNVNCRNIVKIDNAFWICTYGNGLYYFKNKKVKKLKIVNRIDESYHTIEEDKLGNFWISTNDGLLFINKENLYKKINDNAEITFYTYTSVEGLLTNEFNGGCSHPSFKYKDSLFGFPNMKGVVLLNPNKVKPIIFSGKINIDKIFSSKKNYEISNNSVILNPNENIINVIISYPYFYNRKNVNLEYRFNNEDWIKTTSNDLVLYRPGKGEYKLEIRVSTFGISNSTRFKSILINFEPKFYETAWFKILCIFIFASLVYFSFRIGKNINRKNELILVRKVKERTAQLNKLVNELSISKKELTKSLEIKEILIKEIHHRVKNNLQLVISLLNIQSRAKEYKSIDKFLFEGQTRIKAMMLIHEKLYQNQLVESLDLKEYLISLYDTIYYTYKKDDSNINFKIKIDNVFLNLETAIPIGLIVNEILTNAMKYAFKENEGEIQLECKKIGENLFKLIIKDNGVGFSYEKISKKSFGIELIHLLVNQLHGKINIVSNEGTCYEIIFNDKNLSIL